MGPPTNPVRFTLEKARTKARVGVEWAGTFEQGTTYTEGDLCTRNGGLWLALRDTAQTPGTDPVSWRLICKEGRAQ
jgi:hypothetical protein